VTLPTSNFGTTSTDFSTTNPPLVVASGQVSNTRQPAKDTVKVLHLINGEHFSGAERVQDLLGMAMPQFGYEVGFACVKPDKFPNVRNSVDCEIFETKMKSKFDFLCASRVAKVARDNGFRLLHAHTPRTLMIGQLAARKLNCPLVYHVHSPVGRDSDRGFVNKLNTMMEACKITVVSNGVQAISDLPDREDPADPWTIGTMALFRPRKGTEVLLKALAILKEENINVRLRAVGPFETPEYEKEIMQQVDQLGVGEMIDWMGFQTDVNLQLRAMDLFVLPSLYGEGLPMVVLEAMANAVPVVASRVEGIPEAVRDGIDGLIFEPADANDLANKLKSMIGDKQRWRAMSESSLERQRNELSDISMTRGVAAVYDQLLDRS